MFQSHRKAASLLTEWKLRCSLRRSQLWIGSCLFSYSTIASVWIRPSGSHSGIRSTWIKYKPGPNGKGRKKSSKCFSADWQEVLLQHNSCGPALGTLHRALAPKDQSEMSDAKEVC